MDLDLSWVEDDEGNLIVSGCASVPEPDNENEIITKEAIEAALPNFMKFPVLHLDHTERPIGPITEVWFEGDKLMLRGSIKPTDDCADVRNRIKSGELAQYSVYGRRLQGTPSCRLNPAHRSEVCKTTRFYLDSISVCPKNHAIQEKSYLEHNGGGIVVKSTNTAESAMVHATTDRPEEIKKMDEDGAAPGPESVDVLQQILNRLSTLEQEIEELTSVDPEDIEKAEEEDGGDGYDDAGDEGQSDDDQPGLNEALNTIGDALQMILANQQELMSRLGDGSGEVEKAELEPAGDEEEPEPEDDGYEDEDGEDDLEKGCVKKAESAPVIPDEIKKALADMQAENDLLRKSVCELKKSLKPRETVIIPEMIKKGQTTESSETNPLNMMDSLYGGA